MFYDVTILTMRPGTTPKALPQLDQWLRGTRLGGRLLAYWYWGDSPVSLMGGSEWHVQTSGENAPFTFPERADLE